MKEEEFLATIKLVSGEEVISMVLYLEDEDKVLLSNPVSYTHLTLPTIYSV